MTPEEALDNLVQAADRVTYVINECDDDSIARELAKLKAAALAYAKVCGMEWPKCIYCGGRGLEASGRECRRCGGTGEEPRP